MAVIVDSPECVAVIVLSPEGSAVALAEYVAPIEGAGSAVGTGLASATWAAATLCATALKEVTAPAA